MLGNRILYYNGPGGVRRGPVWQSAPAAQSDWIIPEYEFARGEVEPGGFWGSMLFGGVQAVQRVTIDEPPVTAVWTHDPGPATVYYNRRKKVIKCDYEWDNLSNTPSTILGASSWELAPDPQNVGYWGTIWYRWNGDKFSHLGSRFPYFYGFRYSTGEESFLQDGSSIAWRGDKWSAAGYPFSSMAQTNSSGYNSWTVRDRIEKISIIFYHISYEIMLINPQNPTETYPYRVADTAVVSGECDLLTLPSYYRGAYQFTLKNAVFPSWMIHNLTNSP